MADLSVFLPWTVFPLLERVLEGAKPWKRVSGIVLFCDIAGFTPLTEALTVIGREGAEELTRLINGYFSTMIQIAEDEGGDVLRFGGDSMTLLFPGEAGAQAMRAARRMMEAMERFQALQTRTGIFGLSTKIGAAQGDILLGVLGNEESGYDYYAAGAPLDDSAEAEHAARPGQVICHPSFTRRLPDSVTVETQVDGFGLLRGVEGDPRPLSFGTVVPSDEVFRRLVPPYLIERAGEGVLGEHRGTAVAFLAFEGLRPEAGEGGLGDREAEAYHGALNELYGILASTARRYGGLLNKVDMGDKGSKALLLFGSPYALERREEMALRAAVELTHSRSLPSGLSLKVGITSSPLFTGPVGGRLRREFTVIGDGINLAARLMQAASSGQVICDEATARGAGSHYRFDDLAPMKVKGKKAVVHAYEPAGEAEMAGGHERLLVGREEVLDLVRAYLRGEAGELLCLAGEAGSGKTALLEAAAEEARALRLPVTLVPLGPYSQDRPYSAWRGPLRAILGLERSDGPERARAARDEALSREPAGFRPLLNVLLDLPEESSPALKNLGPKERRDLTLSMLARLIEARGAWVYLIDGLQWADPLSVELAARLLEGAERARWRLLASVRGGVPEVLSGPSGFRIADLPPLTPAEVERVLEEAHDFAGVPPEVREWFFARSRGNPAVVGALVAALEGAGLLRRLPAGIRVDSDRLFATAFPDTLEGLYMARVDHLPRLEREVLQYASILGLSVSFNLLLQISRMGEATLRECLDSLVSGGTLRWDTWGGRPYLRFHETLLREAVYGSLPYSLKRIGHLRVAEFLESEGAGVQKIWPSLALHFEEADAREKAKRYHRLSGRVAAGRFDNVTALRHLEYVCGFPGLQGEDVEDAFTLMDVYSFLGRWSDARGILQKLSDGESKLEPSPRARLRNYLAQDARFRGDWAETERLLLQGIALARKARDPLLEAKGNVNLVGYVYGPTGQMGKAKKCLERVLAQPERPGHKVVRTTAAMNLGVVYKHTGRSHKAKRAFLEAYMRASSLPLQRGFIADNLCALFCETGQFAQGALWGRRATSLLERYSVRGGLQNARYNFALAALAAGRTARVRQMLDVAAREAQAFGNQHVLAQTHQGLSHAAALEGDLRGALSHAMAALGLFRSQRNGRDYRFRLLDLGALYHSLGAADLAREFWEARAVPAFLAETPGDPVADVGLERIGAWMDGEERHLLDPEGFLRAGRKASREEGLQRLLWVAEAAAAEGHTDILRACLPRLKSALRSWPYFDCQLRVLRLEAVASGGLRGAKRSSALRLLSRCMGGVWGLRLACLLASQETDPRRARALARRALPRLAFLRSHSPAWAWEKVRAFPEVGAVAGESVMV